MSPDAGQVSLGGEVATLVVSQGAAVLDRVPLLARRQAAVEAVGIWGVGLGLVAAGVVVCAVSAVLLVRRSSREPAGRKAASDRHQGPEVVGKRSVWSRRRSS